MVLSNYICGIILCSGQGKRFNHPVPKQYHLLSGKKIYLHTIEKFLESPKIDAVVVVVHPMFIDVIKEELKGYREKKIIITSGDETRQGSCYLGLLACPKETTHVVIHDGVRPFIDLSIIDENIELAINFGACDTCIASHDTLVHTINRDLIDSIPPRSEFLRGQTPQSFSYSLILKAHENAKRLSILDATDDCQLVLKLNHKVKVAKGSDRNIKITTEYDLLLAEQLLRLSKFSTSPLPNHSLKNKIFVLTGSSGTIGSRIKNDLLNQGAIVIGISKSQEIRCDLSNPKETQKVFDKIFTEFGAVDGLINCAGTLETGLLENLSISSIDNQIRSNFYATIYSCKFCKIKQEGHIINFSSSSYTRGRKNYLIYSSMKAAIVNFTQGLALERPSQNINCMIPSRTHSNMRSKNFPNEDPHWLLDSKEISCEVLNVLCRVNFSGNLIDIKKK